MGLTLEDIAKQAGVSRSTVSRVVNDQPNVKENVRKRVQKVIQATGYHPNAAARMLVSQRSWTIGLVIPRTVNYFFRDPFFNYLTEGIAQACNQNNYTLAFFLIGNKEDEEKTFPRVSRRGLMDGIILQSGQLGDPLFDRLVASNIPLVIAGRPLNAQGVSYIDVDNVASAITAVNHMISLGYQRIGAISGPFNNIVTQDRRDGYLKALAEANLPIEEGLISEGDYTEQGGYHAMQRLLLQNPRAVFAFSDVMAVGGIRAVRDAGLRVPEDVAFIGFDDLPMDSIQSYQLTTIRQPVIQFGMKAVEMLIDLVQNGEKPARRLIMGTELIIRSTCGASLKK
jgi:LacI family transcriptional regulator